MLDAPDRATTPLLRNADGRLRAGRLGRRRCGRSSSGSRRSRRKHGPESVAFLSTGQIATEEMALLGALAKFGMGMLHGDGNTRQCMATAVVAYKQAFGFDAPPYTYADFEESDVHRLRRQQPVHRASDHVGARDAQSAHRPRSSSSIRGMTETAMDATQHLAARAQVATSTLFYGIARILIENGWIDREFIDAHTNGLRRVRRVRRAVHARSASPRRPA